MTQKFSDFPALAPRVRPGVASVSRVRDRVCRRHAPPLEVAPAARLAPRHSPGRSRLAELIASRVLCPLSLCLLAIGVLVPSGPVVAEMRPLSTAEMEAVVGGVVQESFTNPATDNVAVGRDNFRLSGSFAEALVSDEILVSVFADESKIGVQLVTTGEAPDPDGFKRANFAFRSSTFGDFPIGERAGKALTVRFLVPDTDRAAFGDSCDPDPNVACILLMGNADVFVKQGIRMDDAVIVNRTRILNLTDGVESSFQDPAQFGTLLDNVSFTQDRLFSPAMDAIFTQCPRDRRVQLRLDTNYDPTAFVQVPRGCVRQSTCPGGFGFYDSLARQNPDIFHVFVVNEVGGANIIGRAFVGNSNFVLVRQNLDPAGQAPLLTAALTSHEIGHTRGLNHVNSPCDQTATESVRRNRNLMCPVLSNPFLSGSRLVGSNTSLTSGQCASIRLTTNNSSRPLATDIN